MKEQNDNNNDSNHDTKKEVFDMVSGCFPGSSVTVVDSMSDALKWVKYVACLDPVELSGDTG